MHSVEFLLLFGSSCLAQAQMSTSRETSHLQSSVSLAVIPSMATSNAIWLPTILASAVPDHHNPLIPRDNETECSPRPIGYGPQPEGDDTAEDFDGFAGFKDAALSAAIPTNWTRLFENRLAVIDATRDLGHASLKSYNPTVCAASCDQIPGCEGINIYFERTPTIFLGAYCQNSPSMTVIRCRLWGETLYSNQTWSGHHRERGFQWTVAGSNAYNRMSPEASSGSGRISTGFLGLTTAAGMVELGTATAILALWILGVTAESWL